MISHCLRAQHPSPIKSGSQSLSNVPGLKTPDSQGVERWGLRVACPNLENTGGNLKTKNMEGIAG